MKKVYLLLSLIDNHNRKLALLIILTFAGIIIGLSFPLLEKKVVDEGFIPQDLTMITIVAGSMFCLRIACGLLDIAIEKFRTRIKADMILSLYSMVYEKLCCVKYNCLGQSETELYNNIKQDIDNISLIVDDKVLNAFARGIGMLGGIIGLFIISWKLALVTLLVIPLKYFLAVFFSKQKEKASKKNLDTSASFAQIFSDVVNSMREIRIYNLVNQIKEVYTYAKENHIQTDRNNDLLNVYNMTCDGILLEFITILIYFLGGVFLCNNEITLGDIFAFSMYSMHVIAPLTMLMNIKYVVSGIIPSYERFQSFTRLDEEISGGISIPACNQDFLLECKQLSFRFEGSDENTISNLNAKMRKGDKVAIIGSNGSGKSTLLMLMLRFNTPDKGSILLNGRNIEEYQITEYRKLFSVVNQQNFLFNNSISYNICFHAKSSNREVLKIKEILNRVGMDQDVIDRCFDKEIGENGSNLSGGQRQKLVLARAIYKDAPIFVFDEIENNLDVEGRNALIELLKSDFKDKLVILVTHDEMILQHVEKRIIMSNNNNLTDIQIQ